MDEKEPRVWPFILAFFFVMWMLTWPALLADLQSISRSKDTKCERYRSNLGHATLFALLPPVWFITPFITGFYEHGFQIQRKENCK